MENTLGLPSNPTQERTEFTIRTLMQKYWPPLSFTLCGSTLFAGSRSYELHSLLAVQYL